MTVCPGVAQACLIVGVTWIWSQTDGILSLGTTSLLVPETFKFKHFEM